MKKNIPLVVLFLLFLQLFNPAIAKDKAREYYQITVYHFATAEQERLLDGYLKDNYLPALHRMSNAKIGVFKPIANDTATDKLIYVIIPFKKADDVISSSSKLQKDAAFVSATQYVDTGYQNPAYLRMENMVLQAFPLAPTMNLPKLTGPKQDRVYELRSYESATEKLHRNKVQMFNEGGEIDIFSKLNFNPIFYASVIAGSHMPNLMYMTSFENKAARDEHWKAFGADPAWKVLSALPQYQHNVSKIDVTFLRAADYSDY
jgi:hypothetical protein